jgi:hypothetical protein
MTCQRGQCMVEFAIVAGVFVLLLLGTELIAQFHDIQRQAIIAARQVAFSGTWLHGRTPSAVVEQHGRELHFEQAGWMDPTGSEAVPSREDAVAVTIAEGAAPGRAAAAVAVALRPLQAVSGFLGSELDLSDSGFQRSRVRVTLDPLSHLPAPLDALALDFEEHAAVLGDSWSASGPDHVASRSRGLVPTGLLATSAGWLRPALAPLAFIEPALSRLCLGLLEPEFVPLDRLAGGTAGAPQPGQAGCR